MEIRNHFLYDDKGKQVPYRASPNRGGYYNPVYLIIHYDASPNATGAISWMLSPKSKVSAHLHIDRDGNIIQLLPFNVVGWHAGKSEWAGLNGLNQYSIGFELQNTGTQEYTSIQLQSSQEAAKACVLHYGLLDILGHSDIAPGRKVDPGKQFPMQSFKLAAGIGGKAPVMRTTSELNIRTGAGVTFPAISVLPKETEVNVLSESGSWAQVFVCGSKIQGWVNKSYLK